MNSNILVPNGHRTSTSDTNNNFHASIQQEYKILSEYKMIQSENIDGMYVIPSQKSSFVWFGVIFIRHGLYVDGIFRFKIILPDKFPNCTKVPTVIFESNVVHPLISVNTKCLDCSEAFTVWTEGESHLWQLLKFIQFVFEQAPSTAHAKVSNEIAADLLLHNPVEFAALIKECVRVSRDQIYDVPTVDDKHYIAFERFEKDVHGATLESIRNQTDSSLSSPASVVSWLL